MADDLKYTLLQRMGQKVLEAPAQLLSGLMYEPTQPAPEDAGTVYKMGAMLGAGLPFGHNLKHLRRIAGGYGKVPLYHGTSADNAASILQQGYKLPPSGQASEMDVAKRYGIPWTEWRKNVQTWDSYGNTTQRLSTGPFDIAARWGKPGAFPQGEVLSDLNAKARLYTEAKRRGIPYDDFYEQAYEAQKANPAIPKSLYYLPDAVNAPDLMKPKRPGGVVLQNIIKGADIPKGTRTKAQLFLRWMDKNPEEAAEILRGWNLDYKDIKIEPRKIKRINVVKGQIEGPEG